MSSKSITSRLSSLIFFLYIIVLLKLILFKESFSSLQNHFVHHYNTSSVKAGVMDANLVPVKTICYYLRGEEPLQPTLENLLGNIVLFIPLGFLLPLLFQKIAGFRNIILVVFSTSLFFEVIQLAMALGAFDVDDILLNSIGGIIGYWLFEMVVKPSGLAYDEE